MNILILGGGVFLGAAALDAALRRGHTVTVFNRSRSRTAWPSGVDAVQGDRADRDALARLAAGRRWDAVIDTCGYVPLDVRASAEALRASLSETGRYLFVSSISVYASTRHAPVRETDALASNDGIAPDDRNLEHYGPQKAACEAEVTRVLGDERALLVRPGLIVGPGDRSGRFSYWPWRAAAGGTMLVPDVPDGEPLQFIDVRDLGEWMIRALEQRERGAFNATGPANDAPGESVVDWTTLIAACRAEAQHRGIEPAEPVRVAEARLLEHGVQPWTELPLWLPASDPEHAGFNRADLARARTAGLRTRPLRETIAAVLAEAAPTDPDDRRRQGKLMREREATLLAG
ncbi:MAG TPA: NAD-dependent epimerase/dehydratase family protein [Burkholderiaceae bacterium]|nr:NAD-dependent epimerase/dehydratase family protein [Burkholderiaceae bacterium]